MLAVAVTVLSVFTDMDLTSLLDESGTGSAAPTGTDPVGSGALMFMIALASFAFLVGLRAKNNGGPWTPWQIFLIVTTVLPMFGLFL